MILLLTCRILFIKYVVTYFDVQNKNDYMLVKKLLLGAFFFILFNYSYSQFNLTNVNLQGMGFVTGITSHPASKDVYVRTDVGGAFRWDATNLKWIPITDGKIEKYNVEAIALNPSNANEVFIVVGNSETGMLYKSSDKGETWQKMIGFFAFVAGNSEWRNAGPRLAIDANNDGRLMFYSSRQNGLQKSVDGGVTWTEISPANLPLGTTARGGQNFVVIDPNSGNASVSSTTIYVGVAGNGIYKLTDGGDNFSLLTGQPSTVNFPVFADISSTGILYATYTTAWDGGNGLVYKYATSGAGTNITPNPTPGGGFAGIDVCDTDPNKIITFTWKWGWLNNGLQGIHYSTDGGASWAAKSFLTANINDPSWWNTNNGLMYTWSGGISFDPIDNKKVWFTHGFGVMTARDITITNPVYDFPMQGLEELVVLQVFTAPSPNAINLFAAVADVRGFSIENKDQVPSAALDNGAFGMTSCFDYCVANPNAIVRVGSNQQYWQSQGWGYKSSDGGQSWSAFSRPTDAAHGNIAVSATDERRWVWAPTNIAQSGLNVLPFYTTNSGNNWTPVSGIPVGNNDCTEEWSASKFLVADRVNGSKFYYYSFYNGVASFYRSINGGQTFSKINGISLPANYKMKMEAVPGNEGHLFLSTANGSKLYQTIDGGTTWTILTTVDMCYRIGFGKSISPSYNPTLFINGVVNGTAGLYYSTDFGITWILISNVPIPANVLDITGDLKDAGAFYVATSGRGIFYGKISEVLPIKIIDFNAQCADRNTAINLNWTFSGNSIGTETIVVEKYVGGDFVEIGNLNTSSGRLQYQFKDENILSEQNMYCLKVIENDRFYYSDVRVSKCNAAKKGDMIIWPNPLNDILTISYPGFAEGKTIITITDGLGKIIFSKNIPQTINSERYQINFETVPYGIYFITIQSKRECITKKVFKIK